MTETATQTRSDSLLGETIDERFRLDEKLGEGAVGRVYRATQLSIDRPVALKVLHGEFRRDEEYQKRFRREARAISSFNHPNIVRLIDYGTDGSRGLTYLAMEYVEGIELYDLLKKGRLDPRCALEICHQIAAGLAAAHDAGIIHRDLKASNIILVSVPGGIFQAKVLDFGVAFPRNDNVRMTTDGEVFGTPAYMSPEQTRGKAVEAPSDIYSLGIVLYEMLTGHLPFEAGNSLELMMKHLQESPPPLAENLPVEEISPGLQSLLDQFLEKEPSARFENGAAVRSEIRRIREKNAWGNLQVDTSLELEDALSQWVVPPDASHLLSPAASETTGRDRRDSTPTVAPPETETKQTGVETDVQPSLPVSDEDPSLATTDAPSKERRASDDRSGTENRDAESVVSVRSLKWAVLALLGLSGLLAGGIGAYALLAGGGEDADANHGPPHSTTGGGPTSKSGPREGGAEKHRDPAEAARPGRAAESPDRDPSTSGENEKVSPDSDDSSEQEEAVLIQPDPEQGDSTAPSTDESNPSEESAATETPSKANEKQPDDDTPGSSGAPSDDETSGAPETQRREAPADESSPAPSGSNAPGGSTAPTQGDSHREQTGSNSSKTSSGEENSTEDDEIDRELKNELEKLRGSEF